MRNFLVLVCIESWNSSCSSWFWSSIMIWRVGACWSSPNWMLPDSSRTVQRFLFRVQFYRRTSMNFHRRASMARWANRIRWIRQVRPSVHPKLSYKIGWPSPWTFFLFSRFSPLLLILVTCDDQWMSKFPPPMFKPIPRFDAFSKFFLVEFTLTLRHLEH